MAKKSSLRLDHKSSTESENGWSQSVSQDQSGDNILPQNPPEREMQSSSIMETHRTMEWVRGEFYRPIKQLVSMRIDSDIFGMGQSGRRTRLPNTYNSLLREAMLKADGPDRTHSPLTRYESWFMRTTVSFAATSLLFFANSRSI